MPSIHLKSLMSLAVAVTFLVPVAGQAQTTSTSTQPKAPAKAAPAKPAPAKTAPKPATQNVSVKTAAAKPASAKTTPVNNPTAQPNAAAGTTAAPANAGSAANNPTTASAQPAGLVQSADSSSTAPAASSFAAGGAPTAGGATPAYAAGLGTFRYGDTTATAFSCLRSGTRVFCDFDETKQQSGQLPAGWAYSGVKLILGSGRVITSHVAHYVDQDGSTFDTAELSSNVPVRMIVEYDDVPASYTSAALAFGGDRIQSVPVTDMPAAQTAGTIPARQTANAGASQTASAAAPGTTDPSAAATSAADKASQGIDKANNVKSSLKSLWKKAGTLNQ